MPGVRRTGCVEEGRLVGLGAVCEEVCYIGDSEGGAICRK